MIKTHSVYHPLYDDKEHFIILITGGRGCETPTQGVIMADLTVKQIKDIKEGDFVMGDDFQPRKVLDTVQGRAIMYKIHQNGADDYIVSDSHILALCRLNDSKVDIPLFEYMALPTAERARLFGYKIKDGKIWKSRISVEQLEEGDYCGITLDGNQRYLHADGTVTHNSGKSFSASTFIERLTFELGKDENGEMVNHQILFSRYTMVSAAVSVIPEFMEKIELDGTSKYFHNTRTDVVNRSTGARIMFRGIKTSSGNQTAKLKSIHGLTTFICDEAEEWTDETDFERIMLSIRQKGIQNRIIIIMNPADSNHFIYRKYIKDTHKVVEFDGVPVQISTHPNVLHIHTTYLDNIKHLDEKFLKVITDMKESNPERYAHVVIGQWADVAEGAVFKKWGIVKEFPDYAQKVAIGLDFGYTNDPSAGVRCGIVDNDLYLDELFYQTGMLSGDLARELKKWDLFVYCDSADPRLIDELLLQGIIIYPAMKYAGSILAGIQKMHGFDHIYVTERSYNLQEELRNYVWDKDMNGKYINQPVDAYNHAIDAARYYILAAVLGKVVKKSQDEKSVKNNVNKWL